MPIEDGFTTHGWEQGFTPCSNDIFRDERMTAELMGVAAFLRHLPPDWVLYPSWLAKRLKLGRDKVQHLLKELTDYGYLSRKRKRNPLGHLGGYIYEIQNNYSGGRKPQPENQGLGPQPEPEKTSAGESRDVLNTNLRLQNTNGSRAPKARKPNGQHDYGETFEQLWIAYGRYGNKKPAAQEFNALLPELQAEVIAAVPGYLKTIPKDKTGREMKFNLERFIGNEVYKRHATPESVKRVEPTPPAPGDRKAWSIHLEQWRRFERWPAFLGPEPGFPGSLVPEDMLQHGEQDEADEHVLKILNWMPEHERRECEAGLRRIPSWLETRSKIFASARLEPTPGMDTGRLPCGLLPGLSAGCSGGAGEGAVGEIHFGSEP